MHETLSFKQEDQMVGFILSWPSDDDRAPLYGTASDIVRSVSYAVLTYHQLMELILKTTGRSRPILSLPFAIGTLQGALLEKLPENILTVTRSQVRPCADFDRYHQLSEPYWWGRSNNLS